MLFYWSTNFYMGITAPGNLYSPLLDKYLNIFDWYRYLLLYSAKGFTHMLGYPAVIPDKYHLKIIGGRRLQLVFSCLGTALLSIWFAFVLAYPIASIQKKIKWIAIGFSIITLLNIIRIASLTIIANKVNLNFIDHHTYFNIAVYIAILIMIYFYTKEKKKINELTDK